MRASDHRKAIPLGVKLKATLLYAGFTEEQIEAGVEFDHSPAIGLREVVDGEMTPHPNDWRFIRPMLPDEHAVKTRGAGATTAGSDIGKMKKLRKLIAQQAEFKARVLAKGGQAKAPKPRKPKRQWPSRPFSNRKRSKP